MPKSKQKMTKTKAMENVQADVGSSARCQYETFFILPHAGPDRVEIFMLIYSVHYKDPLMYDNVRWKVFIDGAPAAGGIVS